MKFSLRTILSSFVISQLFFLSNILSQEKVEEKISTQELAKKLANPVASLISVPFQNNADFGIGESNATRNTLNIQPVVPIELTENIKLITRYIVPVISQYNVTGVGEEEIGLSDAVVSAFLSPVDSKIVWGVGSVFLLPTGTDDYLSAKKFGVGPTAVMLMQTNGWTFGGLVNQIWSVAGDEERSDLSQMFLQPFIGYSWPTGAGMNVNAELTQNWEANSTVIWINPAISTISSFGNQKVSFSVGPKFNIIASEGTKADFGVRASVTLIFTK